jgi:uncharacterized protein
MNPDARERAQWIDAAVVTLICFGIFIIESVTMAYAGAPAAGEIPTDASLIALIVQEVVLGSVALMYLHLRGYHLPAFVPRPSARDTAVGGLLYAALALAIWVLWLLIDPAPAAEPIDVLVEQAQFSIPAIIAVAIVNGVYEEFFLLGFVMPMLAGRGGSFTIGLTVLLRVLYHVYQGPHGAVSIAIFGVVLGVYYWRTHRLWPVVCAHVIADLIGLAS